MRERGSLALPNYFSLCVILGMGTDAFITSPKAENTPTKEEHTLFDQALIKQLCLWFGLQGSLLQRYQVADPYHELHILSIALGRPLS